MPERLSVVRRWNAAMAATGAAPSPTMPGLPDRSSVVRRSSSVKSDGSVPRRLLSGSSSPVTREGVPETVMPCHVESSGDGSGLKRSTSKSPEPGVKPADVHRQPYQFGSDESWASVVSASVVEPLRRLKPAKLAGRPVLGET